MVSAVTSFGLFVTLDQLYVEGLIHISELGGDYYRFDEMRQELRGERTGIRYAIGTRLQIQVSRVDLDARKIDFRLVREGEDVAAQPARSGKATKSAKARNAGAESPGRDLRDGRDEAYAAQRASLKRDKAASRESGNARRQEQQRKSGRKQAAKKSARKGRR